MSVIARRLPAARPGRDSAARYVTGSISTSSRKRGGTSSGPASSTSNVATSGSNVANSSGSGGNEEDMISAMFQAQGEQWKQTQETMANATPVYYSSNSRTSAVNVPDRPPPPGYVCYRCGQKGHWIQACPTNNDPNWEGKRVRRTTGIPKSMLKTVAQPPDDESGTYMVNEDGEFVVAVADNKSWQKFQDQAKLLKEKNKKPIDPELECPLTHLLFVRPVKTPCCKRTYSEDAIQQALLDKDFVCPNCGTEEVLLDQLIPDKEMEERVRKYKKETGPTNETDPASETSTKRKRNSGNEEGGEEELENGSEGPDEKRVKEIESGEDEKDPEKIIDVNNESSQQPSLNNGWMPPMTGMPGMSNMPTMPTMPTMPGMPQMTNMPNMQNMPNIPQMPPMAGMPPMSQMPPMPPFMPIASMPPFMPPMPGMMPMMPGMPPFMPMMDPSAFQQKGNKGSNGQRPDYKVLNR